MLGFFMHDRKKKKYLSLSKNNPNFAQYFNRYILFGNDIPVD